MIGIAQFISIVILFHAHSGFCNGNAFIQNQCAFDLYVWSVADLPVNPVHHLLPNDVYSETYRLNPNNGGISLKIATTPENPSITQFAYTYHPDSPLVFYSVSNADGNPFKDWGLSLMPSSPDCSTVVCPAGIANCPDADTIDHCDVSADLVLTLCPVQGLQGTSVATLTEGYTSTLIGTSQITNPVGTVATESSSPPTTSVAPTSQVAVTTTTTGDTATSKFVVTTSTSTTTRSTSELVTSLSTTSAGTSTITVQPVILPTITSTVVPSSPSTIVSAYTNTAGILELTTFTTVAGAPTITATSKTVVRATVVATLADGSVSISTLTTVIPATMKI